MHMFLDVVLLATTLFRIAYNTAKYNVAKLQW